MTSPAAHPCIHPAHRRQVPPWLRGAFLAGAAGHLLVLVWALWGGLYGSTLAALWTTATAMAALAWLVADGTEARVGAGLRILSIATALGLALRSLLDMAGAVDALLLALPAMQLGLAIPTLLDQRALPWLAGAALVASTLLVALAVPVSAVQLGALTVALVGGLALVVGLVHAVTEPWLQPS